jgi:hypothetical protein
MKKLQQYFPGLLCQITSPETDRYNCIAWAAGDSQQWWEPDIYNICYWPPSVPRLMTLDAYIKAFETVGYTLCSNGNYQHGFIKIAMFVDANGIPTHAVRLLPNGKWTSKCGTLEDIEHDLTALCGQWYGNVYCYMKKPA